MASSQLASSQETMPCPFCGFEAREGEYAMLLHMETFHAEGESPFVITNGEVQDAPTDEAASALTQDDTAQYEMCPVDGCGESLVAVEMNDHLKLHADAAEVDSASSAAAADISNMSQSQSPVSAALAETTDDHHSSSASITPNSAKSLTGSGQGDRQPAAKPDRVHQEFPTRRQTHAITVWRNILNMPLAKSKTQQQGQPASVTTKGKRLGRAELGKYAHEQQMPDWLVSLLKKGGQVCGKDVIPVLEQLLEQCPSTKYAYLCHPSTQHISKLRREGGFCGYRNIQMLFSYIVGVDFKGSEHVKRKLPSIFLIQDLIEEAWDMGINAQGRAETGGVKGTRKYIGTPEALAVLRRLEIPCDAQGFKKPDLGASEALMNTYVERYFEEGSFDPAKKVRTTNMPPIYFQHAGHSMTIVGFERSWRGEKNLLVFDPMFHDPSGITRLVGRNFTHKYPDLMLKPYRRGAKYLRKYREFEVLRLKAPPDGFPQI